MHWKTKIFESAYKVADTFKNNSNVVGIAIGGSIAKGMAWKHSDLELCIVVENYTHEYQHFNFMEGLGVEIIQIVKSKMTEFLDTFREPDAAMLHFPIQIYRCKIIYDPTAILSRFKNIYDKYLFHPDVTGIRKKQLLDNVDRRLAVVRELLGQGYYKTPLAHIRIAMNDLLLAYYWQYDILPRSQNRTEYFLKKNSKMLGQDNLYKVFTNAFCLGKTSAPGKARFFKAKKDIAKVAEAWGSNAPAFLEKACDGNLEWGYPKSILYVYKYCMHVLQCKKLTQEPVCDTESFRAEFGSLHDFLDFNDVTPDTVNRLLTEFEEVRSML